MQKDAHPRALTRPLACLAVLCAAFIALFVDQVSKYFLFDLFVRSRSAPFSYFSGWIQQTSHQNFGLTFDLPIPLGLILVASALCIGWLFSRLTLSPDARWRQPAPVFFIGLVLGGALGNLFDRLLYAFVRDWLLIGYISAINVADLSIGVGLIGLLLSMEPPAKKHSS